LDGLLFRDMKEGERQSAGQRLDAMSKLIREHRLGSDEKLAFCMKRMLFAAREKRLDEVREAMEETARLLPDSPKHQLIARYNFAHALFGLGLFKECVEEVSELIPEYFGVLGITPKDIFMKNPDKILPLLPKGRNNLDDIKHLADCMDLCAQAMNAHGRDSG